ncbi:putative WD40 repeats containing protein [Lyophyllum shimeji]|uniref:WD40 repeats containing protein n=1 Tax=Lyophyllum shimeji TaxID=47721 RepID=A0A9P3PDH3_LYOSH|nr:putative WD40 repeats containing protein [Lyophyllum shimeji]
MTEDAQPNERPLNRKGGTVPLVRATQAGKGALQRGRGYDLLTRNDHRPPNGPRTEAYPRVTSQNHSWYTDALKRARYDGPHTKRRRTFHESTTDSRSRPDVAATSPSPLVKPPSRPRKSAKRKAQHEPTELLVDLPPQCRKGAPDSRQLRKQWQIAHAEELSAKTGVPLRFGGYANDCARFVIDDNAATLPEEQHGPNTREERTSVLPPIQPVVPPGSDITMPNMNEEIIIVENVDDLEDTQSSLLALSPMRSEHESHPRQPTPLEFFEPPRQESPKAFEPLRVFKSGVLSLAPTEADAGATIRPAVPVGTESPPSHSPGDTVSRLGFLNDTSSLSQDPPEFAKGVATELPNTVMTSVLKPTSLSTVNARTSFNHEVATLEKPSGDESFRHKLAAFIQLPLSQSDKIRRILHLDTSSVVTVSMRGSLDVSDFLPLRGTLKTSKPGDSVDDACLLRAGNEHLLIFGQARNQDQLSWCHLSLDTSQNDALPLPRPWNAAKKGGVSAVASMMQDLQFATGGYDHVVHLWEVKHDFSTASATPLAIKHTSQVQALLAIQDSSHKLVSAGADCNVHFWDLSSERVVNTLRTSNAPYHLHPTASPFCTLLEVAHRELQFEVRDHRLVPECPVLRFGYNTDKVHGRFIKGATSSDLFACGSRDGSVRLWDLRNVELPAVTATTDPGQKLVQVVFEQSHLVVCSEGGRMTLLRYDRG